MNEWLDTTYCYVNERDTESYSGASASKVLHENKPIDGVFTIDKKEVCVASDKILINGQRLPDYLSKAFGGVKPHTYDLRKDISNAAILPDNIVVAAIGNKIVKYGLDGAETTLLEINSVSDWRCVFAHSSHNVFFSPMNSYASNSPASTYGLYKYDGEKVTQVIQLENRQCIWGIDEDSHGNIYAGVYSLGNNNTNIYKSTDNGNTFTVVKNFPALRHIHTLYVDKLTDVLYVSLGDSYSASQNFSSSDGGVTWVAIIDILKRQMTAIISSDNYRFFGTDHTPYGIIYKTTNDRIIEESLNVGYYSNVFFLRKSDVTGWIYAGFKTDPSATSNLFCSLWVTKDDGNTWEIVKEIQIPKAGGGFWFASNFKDGNLIVGYKLIDDFKGIGVSELTSPVYDINGIVGTILKPINYK